MTRFKDVWVGPGPWDWERRPLTADEEKQRDQDKADHLARVAQEEAEAAKPTLAARVAALEAENAALRERVAKLEPKATEGR